VLRVNLLALDDLGYLSLPEGFHQLTVAPAVRLTV
jgi:hypothetical protein